MHKKIFFLHIPKTAGSTLVNVIERQYKSSEIMVIYDIHYAKPAITIDKINSAPKRFRRNNLLVAGHYGYGIHQGITKEFGYSTMVRDPAKRVVSNFMDIKGNPKSPIYKQVHNLSLKDFLSQKVFIDSDNGQVRRLSGYENEYNNVPYGHCSLEMLELAKINIEKHFLVVGVMEHFDKSLVLMKHKLGWDDIRYVRKNVAPQQDFFEKISRDVIDQIQELNWLDVSLYEFAIAIFKRMFEEAGLKEKDVLDFQEANSKKSALGFHLLNPEPNMRRIRRAVNKKVNRYLSRY